MPDIPGNPKMFPDFTNRKGTNVMPSCRKLATALAVCLMLSVCGTFAAAQVTIQPKEEIFVGYSWLGISGYADFDHKVNDISTGFDASITYYLPQAHNLGYHLRRQRALCHRSAELHRRWFRLRRLAVQVPHKFVLAVLPPDGGCGKPVAGISADSAELQQPVECRAGCGRRYRLRYLAPLLDSRSAG